jgi:secreted trypsin-like serine protease
MRITKLSFLVLLVSSSAFAQVVGGTDVPSGTHPDVVLVVAPTALCTGTLVAPDVVLTAGHCIDTQPKEVLVGSVDYAKPGGDVIAVKQAIAYPDWQHEFDVGVLVLEHPAAPRPHAIASACIAKDLKAGAAVTVVGFGLTSKSGTGTNSRLHEARLAVTDPTCTRDAACAPAIAPNGEFAAGGGGTDSCFGDSGGPIFLDDALIGVVSRGVGTSGAPCGGGGVYVRADRVVAWIERTTGRSLARAACDRPADDGGSSDDGDAGCTAGGGGVGLLLAVLLVLQLAATWPRSR